MTRDESTSKPPTRRRLPDWMRPDMPALTTRETTAVVVVLAVPGSIAAIQGWSLGWVLLGALPGIVLSFVLRARAVKTRPRRAAVPAAALAGAGAAGAAGPSLNRYFGLFLAVVIVISERKRHGQPIETPQEVGSGDERWSQRSYVDPVLHPWLTWLLARRIGQVGIVALASLFTWIMAMAATQVAACATPADGGSPHGPQGPITKAFCGTAGATAGNDALIYALIGVIPVVALIAAVVAIWRLRGGPKLRLAVAAPVVAPASVALAWALAGAR